MLVAGSVTVIPAAASPNGVLISEFRFRGPVGGSDEFVELLNTSSVSVDISGYKLEGCNASNTRSVRTTVPSGVVLEPGNHYLFTNSSSSGGPYSGDVPGDQTYATGFTDTGGVRVVTSGDALIDAAGSSGGSPGPVDCREGGGTTIPATNSDTSLRRVGNETQDSDNNAADFETISPSDPENLSGDTGGGGEPTITKIHEIQGDGSSSPVVGQTVTI